MAVSCGIALLAVSAPAVAAPQTLCVVNDPRVDELSGLVATPSGYVALNDGQWGTSALKLYFLGRDCRVDRVATDVGFDPLDPEDLARTPDGTLWVGDIGDNDRERGRIAVNRIPAGGGRGTPYRLTYPDRAYDAEALLIQPDRRAVVITKALTGVARLYVSVRPLTGPSAVVPLKLAGEVPFNPTRTKGGPDVGGLASTLVTGAALSPDGRRVALRTYTDAYEWDVRDGDFAKSMTSGRPRRTPLPGEAQGEAISFTADGAGYVTGSEGRGEALRRWTPVRPPEPKHEGTAAATDDVAREIDAGPGGMSRWAIVGAGTTGLLLVGLGLFGLARRRRS